MCPLADRGGALLLHIVYPAWMQITRRAVVHAAWAVRDDRNPKPSLLLLLVAPSGIRRPRSALSRFTYRSLIFSRDATPRVLLLSA